MTVNEEYTKIKVVKLSPKKIASLIKSQNLLIIDVRPKNFKTNNSFIKGAIHVPLLNFVDKIALIPKEKEIIITDWAMKQSPIATKYLLTRGYNILGVLKGGIERWIAEDFLLEKRIALGK